MGHKDKKKKKHKKHKRQDSSDDSDTWVEHKADTIVDVNAPDINTVQTKDNVKNDDSGSESYWSNMDSFLPCYSSERQKKSALIAKEKILETERILNERELNPYIKMTGRSQSPKRMAGEIKVGDGGNSWMARAIKRAKEKAEEEGRCFQDVVIERWGSLDVLKGTVYEREFYDSSPIYKKEKKKLSYKKTFAIPCYDTPVKVDRRVKSDGWKSPVKNSKQKIDSHRVYNITSNKEDCSVSTTVSKDDTVSKHLKTDAGSAVEDVGSKDMLDSGSLTEQEKNELGAKLIKAEMLGNSSLAEKLRLKLSASRKLDISSDVEEVIIIQRSNQKVAGNKNRKLEVAKHQYSIAKEFINEKTITAEENNRQMNEYSLKHRVFNDNIDDLEDVQISAKRLKKMEMKAEERELQAAIQKEKKLSRILQSCKNCFESSSMKKHLVVAVGQWSYIAVPDTENLAGNQCYISTLCHYSAATQIDENIWEEVRGYKRKLVDLFMKFDEDCIFLETAANLKHSPHMMIHCVPLPRSIGELAPIYFKKAILECETEWAMNKKLIDLKGSDIRKKVPKQLPYFTVDFGSDSGFAHVIEDDNNFSSYFGQEIIGGMLDVEPSRWRKPKFENLSLLCEKARKLTTLLDGL